MYLRQMNGENSDTPWGEQGHFDGIYQGRIARWCMLFPMGGGGQPEVSARAAGLLPNSIIREDQHRYIGPSS